MRCALRGEVGQAPSDHRLGRTRYGIAASAAQRGRIAPPPAVAQIADEVGAENAGEHQPIRGKQGVESAEEGGQVLHQVQRSEVGDDEIGGPPPVQGPAREKVAVGTGIEHHAALLDQVAAAD